MLPLTNAQAGNVLTGVRSVSNTPTGNLRFLRSFSGGSRGLYNVTASYVRSLLENARLSNDTSSSSSSTRRHLLQSSGSIPGGIDQPVICLDNGDSLVWDVSNVDTPAGESKHFPVYLKDSLFNSNPDFDYGPFRQLAEFMDDGVNLKNFVYVFQDAGTYVFGDNADNSLITVVSVMEPTARCPSAAPIMSRTTQNLVSVGASTNNEINTAPDIVLIVIIIVGLVLFVTGVILGLYFFRLRRWGKGVSGEAAYRKLGHDYSLDLYGKEVAEKLLAQKEQQRAKRLAKLKQSGVTSRSVSGRNSVSADAAEVKRVESEVEGVMMSGVAIEKSGLSSSSSVGVSAGQLIPKSGSGGEVPATGANSLQFWEEKSKILLEDFSVRTLYDKLQDQTVLLMSMLNRENLKAVDSYAKTAAETNEIKQMIARMQGKSAPLTAADLPEGVSAEEVKEVVESENGIRTSFSNSVKEIIKETEDMVRRLQGILGRTSSASSKPADVRKSQEELQGRLVVLQQVLRKEKQRRKDVGPLELLVGRVLGDLVERSATEELENGGNWDELLGGLIRSIHRKMGDSRNRSSDEVAEACLETMEVVDTFNRSRAALDRDRSEVVKNGKFSRNEAVRLITNYIDQNQPNTLTLTDENLYELAKKIAKIIKDNIKKGSRGDFNPPPPVRPEIRIQEGEIILPPGVQLPPGVDPEDLNQMTDEEISRMIMDYQEGRIDMEEALQRQKERQMQKLQERMDRQRRKREEKHQRELDDAARELAQEEAREQKELEDRLDLEQEDAMEALEEKLRHRLENLPPDVDDATVQRLRDRFELEKEELARKMEEERRRQRQKLEQKVVQRRRRVKEALETEHEVEAEEEEKLLEAEAQNLSSILDQFADDTDKLRNQLADEMRRQQERMMAKMEEKRRRKQRLLEKEHRAREEEARQEKEEEARELVQRLEAEKEQEEVRLIEEKEEEERQLLIRVQNGELDQAAAQRELMRLQNQFEEEQARLDAHLVERRRADQDKLERRMAEKRRRAQEKFRLKQEEKNMELLDETLENLDDAAKAAGTRVQTEVSNEHRRQLEEMEARLQQRVSELENQTSSLERENKKLEMRMRRESEEAKKKLEELEQELVQNYDEQRKRAEEEYESELKEEHTAEEIQRINQRFNETVANQKKRMEMEIRRQRELLKQKQAKKKAQLQRQIKAQEDDRKRQVMDSQIGVSSALKDAEEEDEAADKDLGRMLEVSRHSDDGAPAAGPSTGGRKPSAPSVAAPAEARDLQAYGAVVQIDEDEVHEAEELISKERFEELRAEAARRRAELEAQLEREKQEELARAEDKLRQEFERKRKEIEEQEKQRFAQQKQEAAIREQAELESVKLEKDRDIIKARYESELAERKSKIDLQRRRQEEKLEFKKQLKLRQVQVDIQKKKAEEKKVRMDREAEAQRKRMQEAEEEALETAVQDQVINEKERHDKLEVLIRRRQAEEFKELLEQQAKDLAEYLDLCRQEMQAKHEAEEIMQREMARKIEFELENSANCKAEELQSMVERHEREMQELAESNAAELKDHLKACRASKKAEQAEDRVNFKRRHMKELADQLEELTPELQMYREREKQQKEMQERIQKFKEDAAKEKQERQSRMEEERKRILQEAREREERIRLETERKEEEARRQIEKLQQELERISGEERDREKQEEETHHTVENILDEHNQRAKQMMTQVEIMRKQAQDKQKAKREKMRKQLLEKKEKQERDAEAARRERERVEAEKRQREEELENQRLEAERRAKEEEERKARQLREEREKVERERRAREEAERLEAARKQLEEEQAKLAEVQKDVDLSALVSGGQGGGAPAPGGDEAVEVAGTGGALSKMQKLAEKFGYDRSQDDHMADVLLKSPLFQKLLQLDEMIHMLNGSHKCYYAGVPYLDVSGPVKDRDLPREGELREVPAQDLSVGELALLNLGERMASRFFKHLSNEKPRILVASSLPIIKYEGNAFKNSEHLEEESDGTRVLFIRRQRLSSASDYMLVLAHACAHVAADDGMINDRSPQFQSRFNENLRIMMKALYEEPST